MCASRNRFWPTVPENPFAGDDEFRVPGVWTPEESAAGQQYVTRKEFAQYVSALNQHGVMAVNSTEDAPHSEQKVRRVGFGGGAGNLDLNGIQLIDDGSTFRAYRIVPDVYRPNPTTAYTYAEFGANVSSNVLPSALGVRLVTGAGAFTGLYAQMDGGGGNGEEIVLSLAGQAGFGWYADDDGVGPIWRFNSGGALALFSDTADPSYLMDGAIWYRSDLDKYRVRANGVTYNLAVEAGPQILGDFSELTIASGVITVTTSAHTVDTEADAGSDDLDSISGGTTGQILVLRAANGGRTVNLIDGLPLRLSGDCALDNAEDTITLICQGSTWYEIARSNNGA